MHIKYNFISTQNELGKEVPLSFFFIFIRICESSHHCGMAQDEFCMIELCDKKWASLGKLVSQEYFSEEPSPDLPPISQEIMLRQVLLNVPAEAPFPSTLPFSLKCRLESTLISKVTYILLKLWIVQVQVPPILKNCLGEPADQHLVTVVSCSSPGGVGRVRDKPLVPQEGEFSSSYWRKGGLFFRQSRVNAQNHFRKTLPSIPNYVTRVLKIAIFRKICFLYI